MLLLLHRGANQADFALNVLLPKCYRFKVRFAKGLLVFFFSIHSQLYNNETVLRDQNFIFGQILTLNIVLDLVISFRIHTKIALIEMKNDFSTLETSRGVVQGGRGGLD